jgi:hypothetical protein
MMLHVPEVFKSDVLCSNPLLNEDSCSGPSLKLTLRGAILPVWRLLESNSLKAASTENVGGPSRASSGTSASGQPCGERSLVLFLGLVPLGAPLLDVVLSSTVRF